MPGALEDSLSRWLDAGVIDAAAAARIRNFENAGPPPSRLRWPVIFALIFGAILLGAGVLLFVAAHWDDLSPASRFALVVFMVAAFHLGAAFAEPHFPDMATALHAIGTIALGAGIYLCGQIFNLSENWPNGLSLWALGAWLGWFLRKDWVQLLFASMLTPTAAAAEWSSRYGRNPNDQHVLALGLALLAITYVTAPTPNVSSLPRKLLCIVGSITVIPLVLGAALNFNSTGWPEASLLFPAILLFLFVPLGLAWWLRRFQAWKNLVAALCVVFLGGLALYRYTIATEAWCAVGAIGFVAWGVSESSSTLINVGTVGFALSVVCFYFTDVMDKLDRSFSLILLGVLFLAGGWVIEKTRRRLIARLAGAAA